MHKHDEWKKNETKWKYKYWILIQHRQFVCQWERKVKRKKRSGTQKRKEANRRRRRRSQPNAVRIFKFVILKRKHGWQNAKKINFVLSPSLNEYLKLFHQEFCEMYMCDFERKTIQSVFSVYDFFLCAWVCLCVSRVELCLLFRTCFLGKTKFVAHIFITKACELSRRVMSAEYSFE